MVVIVLAALTLDSGAELALAAPSEAREEVVAPSLGCLAAMSRNT
jgi:hypothetical protein